MHYLKTIFFGLIVFQGFGQYIYTDSDIDQLQSDLRIRGVNFYQNDDFGVEGSPFVFDEFKAGTILQGERQIEGLFKLNAITQNIFWGDDNKIINPNKSVKVELFGEIYKYMLDKWVTEVAPRLYKYHRGIFKKGYKVNNPFLSDQPPRFIVDEKYFTLKNGKESEVSRKKALKIIKNHEQNGLFK